MRVRAITGIIVGHQPVCSIVIIRHMPGMLTGKVRKGQDAPEGSRLASGMGKMFLADEMVDRAERLIEYAESKGHTVLELAFSWLLAQPSVLSVIAGATRPAQIEANAGAAGWTMTAEDLAAVDAVSGGG